jgi:hypothetical protein
VPGNQVAQVAPVASLRCMSPQVAHSRCEPSIPSARQLSKVLRTKALDSGSPRRGQCGQCDGERVAAQDHKGNQPPDGAFDVGLGADQLGHVPDRCRLGLEPAALGGREAGSALKGGRESTCRLVSLTGEARKGLA